MRIGIEQRSFNQIGNLFLAVSPLVLNLYLKSDKHCFTGIDFRELDKRTAKSKYFLLQRSPDGQLCKYLLLLRTAESLGMRPLVNRNACKWLKDIRTRGCVSTIQEQNAAEES